MSDPTSDERDPIDLPYVDDDERAEVEWLQARAADPSAPAPTPALAREYAELEGLLAALPDAEPDDLAQARVMAAIRAERKAAPAGAATTGASSTGAATAGASSAGPATAGASSTGPSTTGAPPPAATWWRWAAGAGALAAAAGLAIYIGRPAKHPGEPELAVVTRPGPISRGGPGEVHVGDTLVVNARPHGATELRIYRGARIVIAHCPGDAGCATADAPWHLELEVKAPVDHHVILVFGAVDAPLDATLDDFLAAARAAGARVVESPPIDVR